MFFAIFTLHVKEKRKRMGHYLLCATSELAQDVEERDLWDNKLLLFILVKRRCWEVKGQKKKGGLRHLLLVLLCYQQRLFLFW